MLNFKQCTILSYSVFPRTELQLRDNDNYEILIERYTPYRDTEYRTITDFLFCELFPIWKPLCNEFYYGIGPRMKDDITITQKEINAFDIIFSEYILPALLSINFKETTWEEFKLGIQDILFG